MGEAKLLPHVRNCKAVKVIQHTDLHEIINISLLLDVPWSSELWQKGYVSESKVALWFSSIN
jgi:ssDNA-specific exonuclease RecJ